VGKTDLEVSEISLGCWTLGGRNWKEELPIGWADPDEKEVVDAVRYAVDHGVNHFDNADVYGNGRAERMLARALDGVKDDVIIATKVGHFPGTAEHAYAPLHIRNQCEQSLENLKRGRIDIYYFHHGDFGPEDRYLEGAVETVRALQEEGKIRYVGLSAYSGDDFERLVPVIEPDLLQAHANLLDTTFTRPGNRVTKLMRERGLSLVCFGPLSQGLLLDKFDAKNPPRFPPGDNRHGKKLFEAESLSKIHARLLQVKARFGPTREDLARVAMQYLLAHEWVACPIVGFRNLDQVKCNVAAADKPLSAEDVTWLDSLFAGD
jgi:aryl-alcohol dehydrogenase-like predicted oxidoreductase